MSDYIPLFYMEVITYLCPNLDANSADTKNLKLTNLQSLVSFFKMYRQVSIIRCTLVGNKIVDHSDVVGASPVGAAPTTSPVST